MSIFLHDEYTIARLIDTLTSQDLRTTDGRLLGRFIPAGDRRMAYPEYELVDEAIEAWDANTKFYTAEEVMERLRQLMKGGEKKADSGDPVG